MALPILATALYAFSTEWNKTILPEGLTFEWIRTLFQDARFIEAFGRSVLLSGGAVVISILCIVPAIFVIVLYFPNAREMVSSKYCYGICISGRYFISWFNSVLFGNKPANDPCCTRGVCY